MQWSMSIVMTFRAVLVGAALLCAPILSLAQTPAATPYEPKLGQPGKDVMWLPSPDDVVVRMLQMADVRRGDLVVDLGSGDGKIPIAAVKQYGVRALGLEYDPKLVEVSIRRAREAGVADKTTFQEADIFVADFSKATVVTMYLLPELNLRLRPILFGMRPGTRVVSNTFSMGDWQPDEIAQMGRGRVMAWKVPANAAGDWDVKVRGLRGAPERLTLRQKFQMLQGEAVFGKLAAGLVRAQLSGDAVTFSVRPVGGELLHFRGRVSGNRITGTVAQGSRPARIFEAVRPGAAPALEGLVAGQPEMLRAQQELNGSN